MSDLRTALDVCRTIYSREGELTPALLVEEARPTDHPLHDRIFDRQRKDAADAWYEHRAEQIIKKIVRVVETPTGDKIKIREFSPVRESQPHVFDPIDEIVKDELSWRVLMGQMEREWTSMKQRYDHLTEFWKMVQGDAA